MTRRMSCSMTIDAVKDRTKTVTRRDADTWKDLKPGDRLTLIEKGMGLARGEKQVELAEVVVTDVRVEPIGDLTADEIRREGFDPDEWTVLGWAAWWAKSHGLAGEITTLEQLAGVICRRIEWRYLWRDET